MPYDFSNNATVKSLDEVPADFQSFYTDGEDGTFVLDTENPVVQKSVSIITGLNKSLAASRREAKDSKGKQIDLGPLAEFGDSVDAIVEGFASRIAEVQTESGKKSDSDVQKKIDGIKNDLLKANERAVGERDTRIQALTGQLYKQMVTAEAVGALADTAVSAELALPFVEKFIQVTEVDGKFVVQVVDEEGLERHGGTGNPMTIKELVAEMKGQDRYAPLFKSDAKPGGDTPPGGPSRRAVSTRKIDDMTSAQKIASGLKKGQHISGSGTGGRY